MWVSTLGARILCVSDGGVGACICIGVCVCVGICIGVCVGVGVCVCVCVGVVGGGVRTVAIVVVCVLDIGVVARLLCVFSDDGGGVVVCRLCV